MPLPKEVDERIRKRFDGLIEEGEAFITHSDQAHNTEHSRLRSQRIMAVGFPDLGLDRVEYGSFVTKAKNLFRLVVDKSRYQEILEALQYTEREQSHSKAARETLGILKGLKEDFESGMLDGLSHMIETSVTHDFMEQANQLLGGERHDLDHVPAAVLAGAVLEDAVRRLCQRQEPQIEIEVNGKPKRLDLLISELQKRNVYSKPKSAQLRSWAAIRNSAAHGKFDEFDRAQVEQMLPGIETFLVDYL